MVWHYRLILDDSDADPGKHHIGLREVYHDQQTGILNSWTESAVSICCDAEEGEGGLQRSLAMALSDTLRYPMLKLSEMKPGETVVMPPRKKR